MFWRALLLAAGLIGQGGAQTQAPMAKGAHPSFEVAAIRLSDPASHRQGINATGHRLTLHGQTVTSIMMFAYGLHPSQIVEGPQWRSQDRYEIDGVADAEGEPNLTQMQEMLQKLLVDRFGLKVTRQKREMTYYGIVVGKGGPKLTKSADPDATPDNDGIEGGGGMRFKNHTIAHFALAMQYFMDRPVIDETGLTAMYDFTLRWTPGDAQPGDGNAPPNVFTAVQEQLGLKFEAKKGPVDVMVIDRLERPTAN